MPHTALPVVGYRKDGRPIFPIRGGSTPVEQAPPAAPPGNGNTITIPAVTATPPPTTTFDPVAERTRIKAELQAELEAEHQKVLSPLSSRLEALEAQRQKEIADAAAEAKKLKDEAEAERKKNSSYDEKLAELGQQVAATNSLLAHERRFQEVQSYRAQAIAAAGEDIMPAFHRIVTGTTEADVDASIATAKELSADVVASMTTVQEQSLQQRQAAFQAQPGTAITGVPPIGPEDLSPQQQTIDVTNLSDADYAANRKALLAATGEQYRAGRGR